MKYIKMLGLLAVAAAALMAFAGSASADYVTSSTGSTPTIHATSTNSKLHNLSLGVTTECEHSTVEGTVTTHGPGQHVTGHINTLTFTGCNNHVTVLNKGTLTVSATSPTGNGTLFSTGAEITVQNTSIGISCLYTTNNTHIGTLTGSATHSVLDIGSSAIPRTGHSAFCGSQGQWTGNYTVLHPTDLTVHAS